MKTVIFIIGKKCGYICIFCEKKCGFRPNYGHFLPKPQAAIMQWKYAVFRYQNAKEIMTCGAIFPFSIYEDNSQKYIFILK